MAASKGTVSLKVQHKLFMRALRKFSEVTRKSSTKVLKDVAKLVVRDAMSLTPPNHKDFVRANDKGNIPWKKQKEMGENAIIYDLLGTRASNKEHGGVFRVRKKQTFARAKELQKTLGKDMAGMQHAIWATKEGKVYGVEKNLYQPDASIGTMRKHHYKYRGANGRVSRGGREDVTIGRHVFIDKMFVTPQKMNAYMKYLKKRIGQAKAGWNAAAQRLKTSKIPKWVKMHGTSGGSVRVDLNNYIHPTITIQNKVGYAQKHGAAIGIVRKALKSQTKNLMVRIEAAMKHAARKAKLKGK
tara:strand:+ start:1153 stop:2049 length:897 start_codon:yes stop_codon:yes gene_type:complete